MLGAGTVINPIIKIVTTVAILAAVGIFIVRPVLDTTEEAIDKASEQSRQIQENVNESVSEAQIESTINQIQTRSSTLLSTWPEAARELRTCARTAGRDVAQLDQCINLASRISGMLSPHNIAANYADSLTAQGDAAAAERIEDCMADAGFSPGPVRRCQELAEKLLFG